MKAEFEFSEASGCNVLNIDGPAVQHVTAPVLYLSVTAHVLTGSGEKARNTLIGMDYEGLKTLRAVIDTAIADHERNGEGKELSWGASKSPATSKTTTSVKTSSTKTAKTASRKKLTQT